MRFVIRIEIPALDALVAWLKANDQAKIDAITAVVAPALARMKATNARTSAALKAATQHISKEN